MKLEVPDRYKKDEKKTTNSEAVNGEYVLNKAYLDEKFLRIHGRVSYKEKDYNEFKLHYNKQSVEETLVQRAVKTIFQILYDEGLFDSVPSADKVLKNFLFVTSRRPDLEKVNIVVHCFYSKMQSNIKFKIRKSPFFYWIRQRWYISRRRTIFKWYWPFKITSFERNSLGFINQRKFFW